MNFGNTTLMARCRSSFLTAFVIALSLLLAGSTSWAAKRDKDLYLSAKKEYDLLRKGNGASGNSRRWETVAERFQQIPQEFPRSAYADDALFYAGKSYQELYSVHRKERALDLAIKQWRALLSRYPNSPLAPEARYILALSYEEGKGDGAEARKQYLALIEKFPRGNWTAKAQKRLKA